MPIIIGVKFEPKGKTYYFDPKEIEFSPDEGVIVETARGLEYGQVSIANTEVSDTEIKSELKPVIRKADEKDTARLQENNEKREIALKLFKEKIERHNLNMKAVDVHYAFDRSKVIFFFTAEGRVDFRDLVKDMASVLHTRIELRQIYERDDIKMRGAIAPCGRPCCCINHLADFEKVSIKMAKTQGLSLNPAKISGTCGKLMCCLKYENDHYAETTRLMPKIRSRVMTKDGEGIVEDVDILRRLVKTRIENKDGGIEIKSYKLEEINPKNTEQAADDTDGQLAENAEN